MRKLAYRADLCYNLARNIVVLGGAVNTPSRIHLIGDVPMDTLPPHASNDNPPLKRCSCCPNDNQWHPATTEFFHRDKANKDGLNSRCKTCQRAYYKNYTNRAEVQEHRRVYHRAYYTKEYRQRPDVKTHTQAYNHAYWKTYNPPPESRERQRAFHKTYDPIWRSQLGGNEYHRVYNQTRYVRKKAIPGTLTPQQVQTKLKAQKYTCYYCFAKFEKTKGKYIYHLEHTIPISRTECEPRHDINYVVLSCPSCNRKKHDKLPHEFPEGGRLF